MLDLNTIPKNILENIKIFLGVQNMQKSLRLIEESRVSPSFSRGDLDNYFIISGIIRDNKNYQAKVSYKNKNIQSNCTCSAWNETTHCSHTASLFLTFFLQQNFSKSNSIVTQNEMPPVPHSNNFSVNVYEYGTIIDSPKKLRGASQNSTYSSLQYFLHNSKIVNFPIPEKTQGTIIFNIKTQSQNISYSFSYKNSKSEVIKEISILEHLYLFNWRNGQAYNLPFSLKPFFQSLLRQGNSYTTDSLIDNFFNIENRSQLELMIDDQKFNEIKKEEINYRVLISKDEQKKNYTFSLQFYDNEGALLEIPSFIKIFSFNEGFLNSFKSKRYALEYIQLILESYEYDDNRYKRYPISIPQSAQWDSIIKSTQNNKYYLTYSPNSKSLHQINNLFLFELIKSIHNSFGELVFKNAHFSGSKTEYSIEISSSQLFSGISQFYKKMNPYGLLIFYNQKEISSWNSKIHLNRRGKKEKWFNLELNINKHDFEIIKKTDFSSGIALSGDNLILLNDEQKNLFQFIKRCSPEKDKIISESEENVLLPIRFSKNRIFELFELKKIGITNVLTKEEEAICNNLATLTNIPDYPIPKELTSNLRSYQITGYKWLRFLYENKLGACLADDMGLGKTIQTIAFLQSIINKIEKVLIICPVSILLNWENEFKQHSNIPIQIYHGEKRKLNQDKKVILSSYGIVKKEVDTVFADHNFDILILDEVQHIKNIKSQGAITIRRLNSEFTICLTGTPVENDISEFYNILDIAVPGIWGETTNFRQTSEKKNSHYAKKISGPFLLKRRKENVLNDLPPKVENNVYLNFSDNEKDNYQSHMALVRRRIIESSSKKKYGEILKSLLELRQKCLWQKNIHSNEILSTKTEFLINTLEQIQEEGHSTIIFSQFTKYLDIIENNINKKLWLFSRIDGNQSIKRRQKEVDLFQSKKNRIFLISLKAGGFGLNLTEASYVFIMDPWWNPAVEAQAIDRAHRIGQKNSLTVYRPIIKNSIEEGVLKLQESKKELFKDLLHSDDIEGSLFTGRLSMKDFEHLFES